VLVSTDPSSFTRSYLVNGVPTTVRDRGTVLTFTSANWNVAQTVYVAAANDTLPEGPRTVVISHSVEAVATNPSDPAQAATLAAYNHSLVRNVEVKVIDDDEPGMVVIETGGKTQVLAGNLDPNNGPIQGISDTFNLGLTTAPAGSVTFQLNYDHTRMSLSGSG